ncbi:MAG: hypothetical protein COX48_02615 [bacterium (Candidatus Stahlbacteria) CG23_combo_of_CG06-09_8_20_14_all_34_7]|nr:MAG: hypothetical protein COX48_02615 [bacterium (Candidatus Stahlbacteria) CG23_combo_of_CG06-09_8_20_14_all_34_7]
MLKAEDTPCDFSCQNVPIAIVRGTIIIILQEIKIGDYTKDKEREVKIDYRRVVSIFNRMQFAKFSGQIDSPKLQRQKLTAGGNNSLQGVLNFYI